ncbi:MAG: YggS family pyridoxal phosphate-dependent enzyme [Hyphomicrobiales bacterium]|nr:YggS family pyridoxal phosphate-dependent enzyme [Hyphomicrobiales bacterium]
MEQANIPLPDRAAGRLAEVRARIDAAAKAAGRDPASVRLIAVGKTFGADAIEPVIAAGQRLFGENRIQEAQGKWPALKARYPDVQLHLIGPLQSNKVKDAVALFDVIETVDRPKIARAIAAEMERAGRWPRLLVQVNTGEEPQKAGVLPAETDAFVARCREEHGLEIEGLMCIPPLDEEPALHFALMAKIAERLGLPELSMGMSADFETAIAFGATYVRVGTAVFGPRGPR